MAIDTDEHDDRHNTPQTFENARVQEHLTVLIENQLGSVGPVLLKKYFPDGRTTQRENAYKKLGDLEYSLKPFLGDLARTYVRALKKKLEDYDLYHCKELASSSFDNSKIHKSLGNIFKDQIGSLGTHLLKEYFPEEHTTPKKEASKKLDHMETILEPFLGEPLTKKCIGSLRTKLLANGVYTH
jgi:hypothetical protein